MSVVNGVVNTIKGLPGQISSALSGVVEAFTAPFRRAYDSVKGWVDSIKEMASNIPVVGGAFAGGEIAAGGETFDLSSSVNVKNETVKVEVEEHVVLDLINVPAHIDTPTLIKMLQDKEVLRALTGNKDFQTLDAKVKEEILARVNRAKGV